MAVSYVWAGGQTDTTAVVSVELTAPATTRLAVSTSVDLSGAAYTTIALDANNVGKAALSALAPVTTYHYGVELDGVLTYAGHFSTLPAAAAPASFVLIVGACSNFGNLPVYDRMAEVGAVGAVHMGDLHYNDIVTEDQDLFRAAVRTHHGQSKAAAFWRSLGLVSYMIDDHDSWGGNNGGGNLPGRDSCVAVYRQVVPHRPLVNGSGSVNHVFDIGRVRFIVPDLRYHRDPEADPNTLTKTVLGSVQKQWFKDQLAAARTDPNVGLTVFVSSLVWLTDVGRSTDTWERYRFEKRELAQYITSLGDPGWLCMIAGDAHKTAIDSGASNDTSAFTVLGPSFPILQSAPIVGIGDDDSKGGPFDIGEATLTEQHSQYSTMAVADDGTTITVTWTCYRVDTVTGVQTQMLTHTFTNAPRPHVPTLVPGYFEEWDGTAWRSGDAASDEAAGWTDTLSVEVAQ